VGEPPLLRNKPIATLSMAALHMASALMGQQPR